MTSFVEMTAKLVAHDNHGRYNEKNNGEPYSFNDVALMIWYMRQDIGTLAMIAMALTPGFKRAYFTGLLRIVFYAVGICAGLKYLNVPILGSLLH
jgi:hypothetical protein